MKRSELKRLIKDIIKETVNFDMKNALICLEKAKNRVKLLQKQGHEPSFTDLQQIVDCEDRIKKIKEKQSKDLANKDGIYYYSDLVRNEHENDI